MAHDIREPEGESAGPTLLLIGQPMDASGFTSLAGHFRDRKVVTYDPRGVSRMTEATIFPSHHGGFLGGEFGQQGEPEAFAAKLREVLAEDG